MLAGTRSQIRLAKIYQKRPKYYFFQKKPKRRQFSTHEKRNSGNQPLGADHYFFKYNPLHEFLFQWSTIFFPMRDFFAPTPTPHCIPSFLAAKDSRRKFSFQIRSAKDYLKAPTPPPPTPPKVKLNAPKVQKSHRISSR